VPGLRRGPRGIGRIVCVTSAGDGIEALPGAWSFGGQTPLAFDEHAVRSIPWYAACHELVDDLADHLVPARGRCYELGCSTGTLTASLASRLQSRSAEVIGVDAEPGMIELARARCAGLELVRFETARVEELELEPADLIVSYYTLQFVPRRQRQRVVENIHQALRPAGALILFEKVIAPTARSQEIATSIYHDWKRRQGLSDSEIAAKARSLRGVLEPQTSDENDAMLLLAGFSEPIRIFRWSVWEGLIAHAGRPCSDNAPGPSSSLPESS
jgi:tRNA (cmo5U34)-methyltransferase